MKETKASNEKLANTKKDETENDINNLTVWSEIKLKNFCTNKVSARIT